MHSGSECVRVAVGTFPAAWASLTIDSAVCGAENSMRSLYGAYNPELG